MMIIDLTAQMVPVGIGVVALLAVAAAAIGSSADDTTRDEMRKRAQRLGVWWDGRNTSYPSTQPARRSSRWARTPISPALLRKAAPAR